VLTDAGSPYDWVLEFDIKGLFDNIDHALLLKAVEKHTTCKWVTRTAAPLAPENRRKAAGGHGGRLGDLRRVRAGAATARQHQPGRLAKPGASGGLMKQIAPDASLEEVEDPLRSAFAKPLGDTK
jgi:hypothetical protein